jgi:hypothetical protein
LALLAAAASFGGGRALAAEAGGSAEFEIGPAGEELFAEGAPVGAAPAPGTCIVIFRYSRLSASDVSRIALSAPGGQAVPLQVEPLFAEFGRIADARMAFELKEADAAAGAGPFTLRWGPDVQGQSTKVEKIGVDPAHREAYRGLRPRSGGKGDPNIASIEVIADSSAEYHFFWYLLPMSMVFALLLVRKLLARGETGPSRP